MIQKILFFEFNYFTENYKGSAVFMLIPYVTNTPLTEKEKEDFFNLHSNSKMGDEDRFMIEGLWFRTQENLNRKYSNWRSVKDQRRRVIHSMQYFGLETKNEDTYLALKELYVYLSVTLPKNELESYFKKITGIPQWELCKEKNYYLLINKKSSFNVKIMHYQVHPQDLINRTTYFEEYEHLEIFITSKNVLEESFTEDYLRIWELYQRGLRLHPTMENPEILKGKEELSKIKEFLPAQLEVGCGPSIESEIPALDSLHEVFGVQNKLTHEFYLGERDNFVVDFLNRPDIKLKECCEMPLAILKATPSLSHLYVKELFDKGIFVGNILSNNFDSLFEKIGLEEVKIRRYSYSDFYPEVQFDKAAKSLIVLGCHADRRKIQEKARKNNLKIIYINPQGYHDGIYREKKVEALKDEDILIPYTAEEAMNFLNNLFLNKNSEVDFEVTS